MPSRPRQAARTRRDPGLDGAGRLDHREDAADQEDVEDDPARWPPGRAGRRAADRRRSPDAPRPDGRNPAPTIWRPSCSTRWYSPAGRTWVASAATSAEPGEQDVGVRDAPARGPASSACPAAEAPRGLERRSRAASKISATGTASRGVCARARSPGPRTSVGMPAKAESSAPSVQAGKAVRSSSAPRTARPAAAGGLDQRVVAGDLQRQVLERRHAAGDAADDDRQPRKALLHLARQLLELLRPPWRRSRPARCGGRTRACSSRPPSTAGLRRGPFRG